MHSIQGAITERQASSTSNVSQTDSSNTHYSNLKPVAKISNSLIGRQRKGYLFTHAHSMPIHSNDLFYKAEGLSRKFPKARNNERNKRMGL